MKKTLLSLFCLCTAGLAHGQFYLTGEKFHPTGVSNDGLVVGTADQFRPYKLWNPWTGSLTEIGGISAGNGVGGDARFTNDGKLITGAMPYDKIPVVADWTKAEYPDFSQYIFTDIHYISDYNLYAVGTTADGLKPMVMFSSNNGTTWKDYISGNPLPPSETEGGIVSIASLSVFDIVLGGCNGNLFYTTGGGWMQLEVRPEGDDMTVDTYWAMDFIPNESSYDIAKYGVFGVEYTDGSYAVWYTADSGDTFAKTTEISGVPQYITHTGNTFFMVTKNGHIQKSEDYGKTWADVYSLADGGAFYRIRFNGGQKGVAMADNAVYVTLDGGDTWRQAVIPEQDAGVAWYDAVWTEQELTVVGSGGNAYRSSDDGQTFEKLEFADGFTGNLTAVYNDKRGVCNILGDNGVFYRKASDATIDGYCAGIYDIEQDVWTPLASSGYNTQGVASSPYDISGDGNTVVGLASFLYSPTNKVQDHAAVWTDGKITDLGSKFADIGRYTRANGVSYDGSVIVGWQDVMGPWYASVWRKGENGYTQSLLLKDKDKSEADIDFTNWEDMSTNLLGYCQTVSDDGKWIGGTGNTSWYAVHGAWLWNEEEGVIQLTEDEGTVAAVSNDGEKAVGWLGTGSSPWLWTKDGGLQYLEDYVTDVLGCDLDGFSLFSVYDMSPNGRYVVGYGMRGEQPMGYMIDLQGKGTSIEDKVVSQTKASVYPNPVSDELHVDLPYGAEDVKTTLTLVDMQGCAVRRVETVQTSNIINVSNLPQGIYILDVNARGSHKAFKVVVKH